MEFAFFMQVCLHGLLLFSPMWSVSHLVLVSPPGSGKGTLSQYLVEHYGYEHICLGDIVRQEIAAQTPLGLQAKPLLERGAYIPDSVALALVAHRIKQALSLGKPFVLDGFPRSVESFFLLHTWFQEHLFEHEIRFVQLVASDEACMQRVLHRLVCSGCLRVYNRVNAPPAIDGVCDVCNNALIVRSSDKKDIMQKRLALFHATIEPVIECARALYNVHIIDAEHERNGMIAQYQKIVS